MTNGPYTVGQKLYHGWYHEGTGSPVCVLLATPKRSPAWVEPDLLKHATRCQCDVCKFGEAIAPE